MALTNRIRGLLAEFGVVVAPHDAALRRLLADLDAHPTLPGEFKELLRSLAAHWAALREGHDACEARIATHARQDERCVRVRELTGVGPLTADALVATIGNAHDSGMAGN